jgi:hypothetical protein
VLCLVLRICRNFFVTQCYETEVYKGEGMNLLRGTSCIFVNNSLLVFKGLMTSLITPSDESRLINYKLEMTWKGVIVLNMGYYPGICLVTLTKTKINDSSGRNWKPKRRNRPEHHPLDGAKFGTQFYQKF